MRGRRCAFHGFGDDGLPIAAWEESDEKRPEFSRLRRQNFGVVHGDTPRATLGPGAVWYF